MASNHILFIASMLGALGFLIYTAVSIVRLFQLKKGGKEIERLEAEIRRIQADMNETIGQSRNRESGAKVPH